MTYKTLGTEQMETYSYFTPSSYEIEFSQNSPRNKPQQNFFLSPIPLNGNWITRLSDLRTKMTPNKEATNMYWWKNSPLVRDQETVSLYSDFENLSSSKSTKKNKANQMGSTYNTTKENGDFCEEFDCHKTKKKKSISKVLFATKTNKNKKKQQISKSQKQKKNPNNQFNQENGKTILSLKYKNHEQGSKQEPNTKPNESFQIPFFEFCEESDSNFLSLISETNLDINDSQPASNSQKIFAKPLDQKPNHRKRFHLETQIEDTVNNETNTEIKLQTNYPIPNKIKKKKHNQSLSYNSNHHSDEHNQNKNQIGNEKTKRPDSPTKIDWQRKTYKIEKVGTKVIIWKKKRKTRSQRLYTSDFGKKILEKWFYKNQSNSSGPYPSKKQRKLLSRKANIPPLQVQRWFGQRRRLERIKWENGITAKPSWI
ncbi:pre-b-cell leukemia transcription factor [Anaeramoeba flamelloides]|uniref:Pre-b-cell leukemia transcription factor n=1 Tax=Anaeramoeba flamelloides TaxID=1746091 RepID=A0AAV7YIK0_9EUKA|nr:pre-b-cell leukemia transcription factor [Anaeramoeba flamelloides]